MGSYVWPRRTGARAIEEKRASTKATSTRPHDTHIIHPQTLHHQERPNHIVVAWGEGVPATPTNTAAATATATDTATATATIDTAALDVSTIDATAMLDDFERDGFDFNFSDYSSEGEGEEEENMDGSSEAVFEDVLEHILERRLSPR